MGMANKCDFCVEKCPQAERAHQAALGRMYATNEFIALQKKVGSGKLVEVVRCKDCKYWDEQNKELYTYDSKPENKDNMVDFAECLYWSCWSTCHSTRFNDFCSLGERRTDVPNDD